MSRRKRRSFTHEFKAEAVRLVRDSGQSIPAIAKELHLTVTCLRSWMAEDQSGKPGSLLVTEAQTMQESRVTMSPRLPSAPHEACGRRVATSPCVREVAA